MDSSSYAASIVMVIVSFLNYFFIAGLGILFMQLGLGVVLAYYAFVFVFWGWQNGLIVLAIAGVVFGIMLARKDEQ